MNRQQNHFKICSIRGNLMYLIRKSNNTLKIFLVKCGHRMNLMWINLILMLIK